MILEQSFAFSDFPKILTLAFLEMLLSADNAVILGVLTRALPKEKRKKALYIGVLSAFILRAAALVFIAILFQSFWIQLLGGLYLLYLSARYFQQKRKEPQFSPQLSFWKVVFLIELFDIVFAIDSIVAGLAFINRDEAKLWIVYLGAILGILGVRYAADLFSRLLDYLPKLESSAYLIVGWVGSELILSSLGVKISQLIFWSVIAFFFLLAFLQPKK